MPNATTTVKGAVNVTPGSPVHNAAVASKTRKARKPIDPNETARQKFLRLGGVRVGKALQAIKMVGNMSGASYEHTPADVEKIFNALTSEINTARAKFVPKVAGEGKKAGPPVFQL